MNMSISIFLSLSAQNNRNIKPTFGVIIHADLFNLLLYDYGSHLGPQSWIGILSHLVSGVVLSTFSLDTEHTTFGH